MPSRRVRPCIACGANAVGRDECEKCRSRRRFGFTPCAVILCDRYSKERHCRVHRPTARPAQCRVIWRSCRCGKQFVWRKGRIHCAPVLSKRGWAYPSSYKSVGPRQRQCDVCGSWFLGHGNADYCLPCRKEIERAGRRAAKDRRRARLRGVRVGAPVWRSRIYQRDGWQCQLCGKAVLRNEKVPHPLAPTLDHIIPLARGGTHEPNNVQLAHFICNSRKSDRGTDQLRLPLAA